MKIKTYVFDDMKEGMKRIKEEYGVDTIIVDIRNGGGPAGKGCEISIAVEGDPTSQEKGLADMRRRMEEIWDNAARYVQDRVTGIDMDMVRDRVKTYPLPLRVVFDKMVKNGFGGRSALSLISEVFCAIGPLAEESPKAGFFVKKAVGSRISFYNPLHSVAPIAVLGPSGAGKTGTVKKLAHLCMQEGLRVSILALDPSGSGNCEDLRAFSAAREIPFSLFAEGTDLAPAHGAFGIRKIVDLSGPLGLQRTVLRQLGQVEVVMVLPAGARDEKMKVCCDQLKGQHISGLAFTKLDEEETVGHLFDNLLKLSLPLSFLTTGTNETDILTPDSDVLYKILIEGNSWKRREDALLQ